MPPLQHSNRSNSYGLRSMSSERQVAMADENQHQRKKKKALVFVPWPDMGHFFAMVGLAKQLLHHHPNPNLSITILNIPPTGPSPPISSYTSSVTAESHGGIAFHELPKLHTSLLPNISSPASCVSTVTDFHKPHVKSAILDVAGSSPVAAVVADMFFIGMIDVANELGIPFYLFYTSSAATLGFMLYVPTLDAFLPAEKDMEDLQEEGGTIDLPGFSSPMPPTAVPQPFLHRKEQKHMWFVNSFTRYAEVRGIVVNSYLELQPYVFEALKDGKFLPEKPTPPVYPIGPLLSHNSYASREEEGKLHECLQWLDRQPPRSVVFLCFGSMGSFSAEQVTEIAIGLERSGHRFLWVLRGSTPEHLVYVSRQSIDGDLDEVLPKGFLERTRDRGLVWPKFVPQMAILGHKALGGFVTHCGWNSIMESLWFGVPMLAWPMYAEQHFNAFQMVTEMKIAIGAKTDPKTQSWEKIERGIRSLMDDDSIAARAVRSKVMEMSKKGKEAMTESGSSFQSMQKFTESLLMSSG